MELRNRRHCISIMLLILLHLFFVSLLLSRDKSEMLDSLDKTRIHYYDSITVCCTNYETSFPMFVLINSSSETHSLLFKTEGSSISRISSDSLLCCVYCTVETISTSSPAETIVLIAISIPSLPPTVTRISLAGSY